ncbi:MAG: hypothetical protein HC799_07615 [Limnothrix sp. RL_2_0]|nr:hypothetical protein [Limnothrix sp. RL_2_0]
MSLFPPHINFGVVLLSLSVLALGCDEAETSAGVRATSPETTTQAVVAAEPDKAEAIAGETRSSPEASEETPKKASKKSPVVKTSAQSQQMAQQPVLTDGAGWIDMTEEVQMMRNEAIETAIAEGNITSLTGYCYQGACNETFYTFVSLEKELDGERLYDLEVLTEVSSQDNPTEGHWEISPNSTKVLCSTERPMIINKVAGQYEIHHISGGSPQVYAFAGVQEQDALYWEICHDLKDASADEIRQMADMYGYDMKRESRNVQTDFIELFEG